MYGSEYFFENSKLEVVIEDPIPQSSGRVWFNLKTKVFKCSIFENNKLVVKTIPNNIVLFLLLQDISSGELSSIDNITQVIEDNANLVPSSKAVYNALNRIRFKTIILDGLQLQYNIFHGLNSTNLQIFVYDNLKNSIYPNINISSNTNIEITFTELTSGVINIVAYE